MNVIKIRNSYLEGKPVTITDGENSLVLLNDEDDNSSLARELLDTLCYDYIGTLINGRWTTEKDISLYVNDIVTITVTPSAVSIIAKDGPYAILTNVIALLDFDRDFEFLKLDISSILREWETLRGNV